MSTHATAAKQWTESELEVLLVALAGYVYVLLYPVARIPAYIDRLSS